MKAISSVTFDNKTAILYDNGKWSCKEDMSVEKTLNRLCDPSGNSVPHTPVIPEVHATEQASNLLRGKVKYHVPIPTALPGELN